VRDPDAMNALPTPKPTRKAEALEAETKIVVYYETMKRKLI
jgi:hypothetical protein